MKINLGIGLLIYAMVVQSVFSDELFYGVSEELGDISSSTSSKHDEELFSTPLSISIVTAEQIRNSGITTIAEAMKLVPGVIVREQTNGQFDVHIRGLENIISGAGLTSLTNNKTLIMIDNRIVFDYFSGGLFWDTLPIGVEDVDRIEVVRGAVSSLYGANAVSGVIHIFTKRAYQDSAAANLILGTKNTKVVQLSAETVNSGTHIRLSGLGESRDRYHDEYYSFVEKQYVDSDDDVLKPTNNRRGHPSRALERYSVMLVINNDPLNLFNYDLSLFHQNSDTQKVHISSGDVPLTDNRSESNAVNLKLNYGDFNSRFSHLWGAQDTLGFSDLTYDTEVSQASIAYQFKYPKWLIQPGIDWYNITYDGVFIGGERTLSEKNYMLRMEYFPLKRLRFISAFSYSDFNVPKNNYSNYQIMATYQLSFDTSLRASVQSSTSSPFMLNQYIDLEFTFPNNPSQRADVKGDKEGALSRIKTYELGMRNQLDFNNFIEFELFHSEIEDSSNYIIQPVEIIDGQSVTERNLQRLEQKAIQNGATVNWIYEELDWKVNAFLTWQNTEVEDQLESLFVGAETQDRHKKATPRYYGGLNLDWQLSPTVKFNILSNYLEQQTFELQAPQGTKKIPSALYTNLTLSYRYSTQIDGYLSVKNLSDQHESQHFYTDRLEPIYMLGFNIKLDGG